MNMAGAGMKFGVAFMDLSAAVVNNNKIKHGVLAMDGWVDGWLPRRLRSLPGRFFRLLDWLQVMASLLSDDCS